MKQAKENWVVLGKTAEMGTITEVAASGLLWGMVNVDSPCAFGPIQLSPDEDDPSKVRFGACLGGLSVDRSDSDAIKAVEETLVNAVRWSIVASWGASVDQVHVHDLQALVDGKWEQVYAAATIGGRIVAVLDQDQPHRDPATAFSAVVADPSLGYWLSLYSAGLAAHQSLGHAGLLTAVTVYATILEGAGQTPDSLKDATGVADALRSAGHAIPPNPGRHPQQIRSAVAHAQPGNNPPDADEVEWFRATAAAWIADQVASSPRT